MKCTVSELIVFGTATNSSSESVEFLGTDGEHCANEQKFIVFTSNRWRSHGCLRGAVGLSTGKVVSIDDSSSFESRHTMSLLSLP